MSRKAKLILGGTIALLLGLGLLLKNAVNFPVLNPKGPVAQHQLELIINSVLLMLVVVIPVFVLTFMIAWKYRENNKSAKYSPEWDGNRLYETTWWLIPLAIITALSFLIWRSSHDLDPFKPLASQQKPLKVQVVALEWKWLFIYPEENLATVNYLKIPTGRAVDFDITADAPMNSFWIPQLGGQVYAMSGMTTQLHLQANEPGSYDGSSANLSGEGFAGMRFKTDAVGTGEFETWVKSSQNSEKLNYDKYKELAKPSKNNSRATFLEDDQNVFDKIINSYMTPDANRPVKHHETRKDSSNLEGHHH